MFRIAACFFLRFFYLFIWKLRLIESDTEILYLWLTSQTPVTAGMEQVKIKRQKFHFEFLHSGF